MGATSSARLSRPSRLHPYRPGKPNSLTNGKSTVLSYNYSQADRCTTDGDCLTWHVSRRDTLCYSRADGGYCLVEMLESHDELVDGANLRIEILRNCPNMADRQRVVQVLTPARKPP